MSIPFAFGTSDKVYRLPLPNLENGCLGSAEDFNNWCCRHPSACRFFAFSEQRKKMSVLISQGGDEEVPESTAFISRSVTSAVNRGAMKNCANLKSIIIEVVGNHNKKLY